MNELLRRFNAAPPQQAERELLACCASPRWARAVTDARPYADLEAVLERAKAEWEKLGPDDWLEAFAGHPRIGERGGHQPETSDREQSGVMAAGAETRAAIAEENRGYEARFGHVFLISAAGRSAGEILSALRERMHNTPAVELEVAAGEQAKITSHRLRRMLSG